MSIVNFSTSKDCLGYKASESLTIGSDNIIILPLPVINNINIAIGSYDFRVVRYNPYLKQWV